ncbi:MAG: zinc ribbon domain-containing protein [Candidatus Korobacteraceae bacterium]|jgi:hypothetical protein
MFCGVCGSEFPDDFSFCPKCGRSVRTSTLPEGPQPVAATPTLEAEPDTKNQQSAPSGPVAPQFNYGTVVFAAFSVLSLLVCLAKGIVPIYLSESVLWAAVAWYWQKKSPWSETATGIVLLVAVGVAGGEGYLLGRQSLRNNYTYLTQGNLQYRVNAGTGRTDRLDIRSGWVPVSFDRPPETIPADEAPSIVLSNGSWKNGISDTAGEICFDVQNNSHYVLQEVAVIVFRHIPNDPLSAFDFQRVMLRGFGGLLDVNKASRFCGSAGQLPTSATWTYNTEITITGWKQ